VIGRAGLALLLTALTPLAAGAPPAPEARRAAEAKAELRELRNRIEALQKQLTETEDTRSEAVDALRESERAISEARRSLRELAQQSEAAARRLAELRAEIRAREADLEEQRRRLAQLLRHQYQQGGAEPARVLLNQHDPNRIARQLHYLRYIAHARSAMLDDLRANVARLDELAREAADKVAELKSMAAETAAQERRLERERQARAQALAKLAQDIRQRQREIGTLRRDEARLTRLIEQIGRALARAPASARPRNERLPDASLDGSPFEQLKGRLSLPVRGELGNRFGSPRSDGGPAWKGLFIAARAGEEVRAIAAGRVVFADWLRGFGNLLIIDHGGAYMSLYGNNEALYKQVGDVIRGGDPIASVGNSGGSADSGLYFEVRHQGKPLDPLTWVKVR
jgi:septal ring factor EnvC (AmiA/AmiB activator)